MGRIVIDGKSLTIDKIIKIAREKVQVELSREAVEKDNRRIANVYPIINL